MNLKSFDKTTKRQPTPRSVVSFLTLNLRGKVNFSQAAVRHFSLQPGDRVIFHQNQEFRSEWYIQFTKEEIGYKLVFGPTDTRLTAIQPVTEIFKSIGKQPQKLTFLISKRPYILHEIVYYKINLKPEYL